MRFFKNALCFSVFFFLISFNAQAQFVPKKVVTYEVVGDNLQVQYEDDTFIFGTRFPDGLADEVKQKVQKYMQYHASYPNVMAQDDEKVTLLFMLVGVNEGLIPKEEMKLFYQEEYVSCKVD